MSALINELCERDVPEFEVYEEVNEEQARGKRIWNSVGWIHRKDQD